MKMQMQMQQAVRQMNRFRHNKLGMLFLSSQLSWHPDQR